MKEKEHQIFTKRELNILYFVVRGKNNKTISEALSISKCTVKAHISSMLRKINLENRIELAVWAVQNQIIQP